MKKILAYLLVITLLLSMGGCTKRPDASNPDTSAPDASVNTPVPDTQTTPDTQPTPDAAPAETPAQQPEETPAPPENTPAEDEEPFEEPEESPEPSEEPAETEKPKDEDGGENANEGKLDSTATVTSTATDLAPADDSFLSLIPELPYDNWASTKDGENSIMLELKNLGSDAQAKLLEYIITLRDEGFEVTEFLSGCLYEAKNDKVTVTLMLEGGTFSVIIEKK